MMFPVFVVALSILLRGTGADQGNEIPTNSEVHRIQESSKCADMIPLLNKLVHELEDMKGKIMHDIPDQLANLTEELAKQAKDPQKMGNDLAQVKGIVERQSGDIEEMKKSVNSDSCQHDLSKLEASVDALTNGNRLISESLQSHDERLRVHDQRLQNLTTKGCPFGWSYLPGADGCYKIVSRKLTWKQADEACKADASGAHLAAITSGTKQEAIKLFLEQEFLNTKSRECIVSNLWYKGQPSVWISGQTQDPNRCDIPYAWKIKNGVQIPFQYTSWIPGEPNCYKGGENCVNMVAAYNYSWCDDSCNRLTCAICEF